MSTSTEIREESPESSALATWNAARNDYATLEEKRAAAPYIVVDGLDAEALTSQSFQDWSVNGTLSSRTRMVVLCARTMRRVLAADSKFLLSIGYGMEMNGWTLVLVTAGSSPADSNRRVVAYVFSCAKLLDYPRVPVSGDGFLGDLYRHVRAVARRGVFEMLADPEPSPDGEPMPDPTLRVPTGEWWLFPWSVATYAKERHAVRQKPFVPHNPIACQTNEFYGHATILRDYCGETHPTPIRGRVQHGWSPGSGIAFDDVVEADQPIYVWSVRVRDMLVGSGVKPEQVHVIGAPYVYLPYASDYGPAFETLVVPLHSIRLHRVPRESWSGYAAQCAERGVTTACLHWIDFHDDAARCAFEDRGIVTVTCGAPGGDDDFLRRLRDLIRRHRRVASNRMGTVLLYAAYENRRVEIWGDPMRTEPPDQYEELTADFSWLSNAYSGILRGDSADARREAETELGVAHKRNPDDLRYLLFGWLRDDPRRDAARAQDVVVQ